MGIKIGLPSIERSHVLWDIDADGTLVAGLTMVKGISDRTATAVLDARKKAGGTFGTWAALLENIDRKRCNKRTLEVLLRSGSLLDFKMQPGMPKEAWEEALKTEEVPSHEAESPTVTMDRIADAIDFAPDADIMRKYRKLLARATEWWGVRKLDQADYSKEELAPYAGVLEEVKFGYRDNVKSEGTKGYADDLGGIYGNLLDGQEFTMITWSPQRLAQSPITKSKVEGMKNVPVIVWSVPSAVHGRWKSSKKARMSCHHIVMLDDLLQGELQTPAIGPEHILYRPGGADYKRYVAAVNACRRCAFGDTRKQAVPLLEGKYRAVVLAEAPGKDEDAIGKPLVGDSGKVVWPMLAKYGVPKSDVCVTNILKCRPPDNKFDRRCGAICGKVWLHTELKAVRPVVMLVLGGSAAKWLEPGDERNVSERSGTAAWSDTFSCWVVFGPHPASLIYARMEGPEVVRERTAQLDLACQKFAHILKVCNGTAKTEATVSLADRRSTR